jgi:hypothetical protein
MIQHKGAGVMCAKQGTDLVDLCKKNELNEAKSEEMGAFGSLIPAKGSYPESYMDIDIRYHDI